MKMRIILVMLIHLALLLQSCAQSKIKPQKKEKMENNNDSLSSETGDSTKLIRSEAEWKKLLPADVFYVARQKGTERPWTSKYEDFKESGTYYCKVCGHPLFYSDTKFESGCGWPSFYQPVSKTSIIYTKDNTLGMSRTEVTCGKCDSHLGHVFDDGPPPTGLRYCINGVILDFKEAKKTEKKYDSQKDKPKD
jgi:peptide-methionine (R)-S-oxide reductase